MISAHMDEIGYVVVDVEKEGYLRVSPVGGVNPLSGYARAVVFENGVSGALMHQPHKDSVKFSDLFIDIGADSREEALEMVKIGDCAVSARSFSSLGKNRVSSPIMDDRCACALLIELLLSLDKPVNTVIGVFSVQEEVGCRGAKTAAFALEPDLGLAIDVTTNGDTPETKLPSVRLGDGPAIKIQDQGSISSPEIVRMLEKAAENASVKYQREVLPFGGTDASAIQLSRGGIKAGTLSIPCRYVHTPVETIDMRDMAGALETIKEFVKL
ncbi:MAG: M20/M25/M40 family metallo-hydrolase [Eubacteriales bacterium]|nr:M20/M25/M40 family metallo-hydrolase [Eubacteriales bacterium]MDD3880875.1 M20/M25/M40 family metallo-hydrolase [Eubacteriales bacterium]MDD4511758.1 M20/M25/M40 family metallo-hydrolase [Eubacteriales bacterium]